MLKTPSRAWNQSTIRESFLPNDVDLILNLPCSFTQKPPDVGFFKVNTDAAIDSMKKRVGIGTIVRDSFGVVVALSAQTISTGFNAQIAESIAVLRGVQSGLRLFLVTMIDANDVSKLCVALSLRDKEGPDEDLKIDGEKRMAHRLVGKVLANKLVNRDVFISVISMIWSLRKGVDIEDVFGEVVEVDEGKYGNCAGKFIRVRVIIKVDVPLQQILRVDVMRDRREYAKEADGEEDYNLLYDSWLKAASPVKGGQNKMNFARSREEEKKGLAGKLVVESVGRSGCLCLLWCDEFDIVGCALSKYDGETSWVLEIGSHTILPELLPMTRMSSNAAVSVSRRFYFKQCWVEKEGELILEVEKELNSLLAEEENYWRQRSCVLNRGHSLQNVNRMLIILIPKVKREERMTDFWPISLCNVIYKNVAKSLANRFRCVPSEVISDTQSAFIPGRLISDNAIIGFECIHALKRRNKGRKRELALKLDMAKAYDRVEWKFIFALEKDCNAIRQIVNCYSSASEQLDKFNKSALCVSSMILRQRVEHLVGILWVRLLSCHDRYLRLPSFAGRSKRQLFSNICNRVWDRVKGWKNKLFSSGGKEVLLKVVVQAIPTYSMPLFRFPKSLVDDLHRLSTRFWWDQIRIHRSTWRFLCRSKDLGGLGFRDLSLFNKALLAKQASCGASTSFLWRSFVWRSELLKTGSRWVFIYKDQWLCCPSSLRQIYMPVLSEEAHGSNTVRSGYHFGCLLNSIRSSYGLGLSKSWWKFLWRLKVPPKVKLFIWRACHEWIPAMINLAKRGMQVDTLCPLCCARDESMLHAL
ncbi:hypothetical protein Ddye_016217 [Dipteronia dyeriana]|uniref:Reverse transcriptase n=1 Tax=Dipteronia dyeriana TaxID=168575 RepID=A0AAD9U732_9ROSI|nr:hypothetical protein Ddye_016217 [Dipteronia dyeriana]